MNRFLAASLKALCLLLVSQFLGAPPTRAAARGWLSWRGPLQNGTSLEKNLPDKVEVKAALWVAEFPGQSTPVVADGKVYIMGYLGDGQDLQEGVTCFDAETGRKLDRKSVG